MNALQPVSADRTQVVANIDTDQDEGRGRNRHSRPIFHQTLEVNSLQAQKVMDRSFQRVANSLFSIDVILRIIGEQEEIDQIEEIIAGHIEKVAEDLGKTTAQLQDLLDQNGIDELPGYTKPTKYRVEVSSPQIAMFVHLIKSLDKLMGIIDALWLSGILTNKQRSDATYEWQQRLIRLSGRIIGIEKRARVSAHSKGKAEEVEAEAPAGADLDSGIPDDSSDDGSREAATSPANSSAKAADEATLNGDMPVQESSAAKSKTTTK